MVDDDVYDDLSKFKWFYPNPNGRRTSYPSRTIYLGKHNGKHKYKRLRIHNIVMRTPKGEVVDHIDHNGLNCQRKNMRNCSIKENARNKSPKRGCSSKYLGVSWKEPNNKWAVRIKIGNKIKHIGLFSSEEEAAMMYNEMALKYYGEFASLNTIKKSEE